MLFAKITKGRALLKKYWPGLFVVLALIGVQTSHGAGVVYPDTLSSSDLPTELPGITASAAAQTLFVRKGGSDAVCPATPCGDGSLAKPFLTGNAARLAITDESTSKRYEINFGPGSFTEVNTFVIEDFIAYVCDGRRLTSIQKSDATQIVWTPNNIVGTVDAYLKGCQFTNGIRVQRSATGATFGAAGTNAAIFRAEDILSGAFTYNGLGIGSGTATSQTQTDALNILHSELGNVDIHGLAGQGRIEKSRTGTVIFDNTGVISTDVASIVSVTLPTITVATGLAFNVTGGRMQQVPGTATRAFTYTAYDSSTGVFSGVVVIGAAITPGAIMTSEHQRELYVFQSEMTNSLTVKSVTKADSNVFLHNATYFNNLGSFTLDGIYTVLSQDIASVPTTIGTGPTLLNGAGAAPFGFLRRGRLRGSRFDAMLPGDWMSVAGAAFVGNTNTSTSLTGFASTVGILPGMLVTGTGIVAETLVTAVAATTVTINRAATATAVGVSLTFAMSTAIFDAQQAVDKLAAEKFAQPKGTRASPTLVAATPAITLYGGVAVQKHYVQGSGGPIVVTANPQIPAGTKDGQILVLVGRSAVDTVTYANGTGLSLSANMVLGDDNTITLSWDGTNWSEMSRR